MTSFSSLKVVGAFILDFNIFQCVCQLQLGFFVAFNIIQQVMSCRDLMSDYEESGQSYNWSILRKKYLDDEEFRSVHEEEPEVKQEKKYKKYRKGLSIEEIASLNLKKKNLQEFISSIGSIASRPLKRQIIEHCEKVKINFGSGLSSDGLLKLVKNRVEKMIKNKRIKKNWSQEDIKILIWVLSKYVEVNGMTFSENALNENDWQYIANLIPGVTAKGCMFKWLGLKKNNLAQNGWVQEESLLLDFIVKQEWVNDRKYGDQNWCTVSEKLYQLNNLPNKVYRCPKQCRQHWNCYLNPNLKKGPWSKNEDILLLKSVKELNGLKKWAQIVKLFNGRTENALKNRFNLIIEKEIKEIKHGRKKITELQLIERYLEKVNVGQCSGSKLKGSKSGKKGLELGWKDCSKKALSYKEEDQYLPQKLDRKKRYAAQIVKRKEQFKEQPLINEKKLSSQEEKPRQNEGLDYEKQSQMDDNVSYGQLNLIGKEEQQIFEEDEQDNLLHYINYAEPAERVQPRLSGGDRSEIQEQYAGHDLTAQESLNIDASKLTMVQYCPEILEKLRTEVTHNKLCLIPCTLNQDNIIMSYNMGK